MRFTHSKAGPIGFDLDMTLIDSRPQILASFAALANETGVVIDLDVVNERLGLKLEDELAQWFERERVDEAASIYRHTYRQLAATDTVALPGARVALACVRDSGRSTSIITAKHGASVPPCLAAANLVADSVYAFVHGLEKAVILEQIGAWMYVGDTPHDVEAARHAGILGVGVATGAFGPEDLRAAGAAVVLSSLEEFPEFFAEILAR